MKKISLFYISFLLILAVGCSNRKNDNENGSATVVYYEGLPYTGTIIENDSSTEVLNGRGTFITDENLKKKFVLKGTWSNGLLDGDVEITLDDESVIRTQYKNNMPSGTAKQTFVDGNYIVYRYENGQPIGRILVYNKDNEVIGIDRHYNGKRISEWCALSEKMEYEKVMTTPDDYYLVPISFEGIVTDIIDDADNTYILIENEKKQTIIGTYANTAIDKQQALVPNLIVNEKVTVYGFVDECKRLSLSGKIKSNSGSVIDEIINVKEYAAGSLGLDKKLLEVNNESVYSTLPVVTLFYGEVEDDTFMAGVLNADNAQTYSYENVIRYPYQYSYFVLEDTAQIMWIKTNYNSSYIELILQKTGTNYLYYGKYKFKNEKELPGLYDTVSIRATIDGCYKLERHQEIAGYEQVSYVLLPNLIIKELE